MTELPATLGGTAIHRTIPLSRTAIAAVPRRAGHRPGIRTGLYRLRGLCRVPQGGRQVVGGARTTRSPGQSRGPVELLADLVRSVRLAAARDTRHARGAASPGHRRRPTRGHGRSAGGIRQPAGLPETHLQLGSMALTMRNVPVAEGAFREVVRLDPQQIEVMDHAGQDRR